MEAGPRGVGYLLKQRIADVETFVRDVRPVLNGETVLDPVVVAAMLDPTTSSTVSPPASARCWR